jgi:hypothetical protein
MAQGGSLRSVIGQGGISNKGAEMSPQSFLPVGIEPLPATEIVPRTCEADLSDGVILLEGELAAQRLKKSTTAQDWIAVGKALNVLSQQAMAETHMHKPRGIKYVTNFGDKITKHGFRWITKSSRTRAMYWARNLVAVEEWLKTLDDEQRLGLNHPVVVIGQFIACQRAASSTLDHNEHRWRDRQRSKAATVQQVMQVLRRWFPGESADDYRSCAYEVMRTCGLAIPRSEYRRNGAEARG